jgi:hypothetical protein
MLYLLIFMINFYIILKEFISLLKKELTEKYHLLLDRLAFVLLFSAVIFSSFYIVYKENENNKFENILKENSSEETKKVLKYGYYYALVDILTNDVIKKIQSDMIDDILFIHRDFFYNNKRYNFYHFLNHDCPAPTLRVLTLEMVKDSKELDKRNYKILNQLSKQNAINRQNRRVDFDIILNAGNYKMFNLYTNKVLTKKNHPTCDAMDNFFDNKTKFSKTVFSKQINARILPEGSFIIVHDTKDKVFHLFEIHTMQNEVVHKNQRYLNVLYKKTKNINESEIFKQFVVEFDLKFS